MKRYLTTTAALAASLLLGACGAPLHSTETTAMTETAAKTPAQDTTPYCLGRFLIDVPAGSRLSGGSYKYYYNQVEKPVPMSFEQFEQELKALEEKLRSTKHETDPSLLRAIQRPDKNTAVIAYWETFGTAGTINVDGYKWVDGVRFLIKGVAGNEKTKDGTGTRQDLVLNRIRGDILARLRPRADSEIPAAPGYCFAGGFIANDEWEQGEEASVDIDIAGHPDAFISVEIYPLAAHKRDKPLLERMGGVLLQLGTFASGVHVLRKGERQIGPYKGQEYLATGPNSGGMRGHSFIWETLGEGTLEEPAIVIELETGHQDDKGNPQKTKLSDEQALKLWDSILNSFRLRPVGGAPAKTSAVEPPIPPLGTLAATGHTCPHSGVWQCSESGDVAGGARQHFTAGEPLPPAVLLGEPSLWQKLKNERPRHETATVWQLVEYDTVPPATPAPPPEAARNATPPGEGVS